MVQRTVHRRRLFFFLLRTNSLPPLPSPLFPHLPFLSSPSSHLPLSSPSFSPSFRSIGPLSTARGSAERCKLPQCGLGRSPSRQAIWCILESKSGALLAAVFVDFPKNKCNFSAQNKLDIVRRVQFLTERRPMRSFFPEAVATVALWKSAPMELCIRSGARWRH